MHYKAFFWFVCFFFFLHNGMAKRGEARDHVVDLFVNLKFSFKELIFARVKLHDGIHLHKTVVEYIYSGSQLDS